MAGNFKIEDMVFPLCLALEDNMVIKAGRESKCESTVAMKLKSLQSYL